MTNRAALRKRATHSDLAREASASLSPSGAWFSKPVLLACALLILLSVIAYAPVANLGFLNWDDGEYVYANPHVSQGLTWQGARWAFASAEKSNWHPLTWLSHMLDVELHGLNPGPHHVTNLLFHILNAMLLFLALYRMTGAWGRSTFAAGLFAAHPLHVESVAWIAERKDVLSAFFWMLAMLAYASYARRPGLGRYLAVVAFFVLGLMAKPMLVTLPFALLLLDIWPLGRVDAAAPPRERISRLLHLAREKLPLFGLAALSSVVTVLAQRHGGSVRGFESVPLGFRLANVPASYLAYLAKTLWPAGLSAFYPIGAAPPVARACLGALVLVSLTVLAVRAGLRHGYCLVGWLWFLGTLVPVIGLVQVGDQAMADRYSYIPLIGLFLVAAWGAADLAAGWRPAKYVLPAAAACALLACASLARAQLQYWTDDVALWQRALDVNVDNPIAQANLGGILIERGRTQEAIPFLEDAVQSKPNLTVAQVNLGMALMTQGNLDEAAGHFAAALRVDPRFAYAHYGLAEVLRMRKEWDQAAGHYAEALRANPEIAEAHNGLGLVLMSRNRFDQAIRQFQEALRIQPDLAQAARNLQAAQAMQATGGAR